MAAVRRLALAGLPPFLEPGAPPPLCAEVDPELFFPLPGDQASQQKRAKAVCKRCPFRVECQEFATETNQWGVWGGTTEMERRHAARRRAHAA